MSVDEHLEKYSRKKKKILKSPFTISYTVEEIMAEIYKYEHSNNILSVSIKEGIGDINNLRLQIGRQKSKLSELHEFSEELEVIEKQLDEFLYYIETATKDIESDNIITKSKILNMFNGIGTLLSVKSYVDSKPEIRTKLETVEEVLEEARKYMDIMPASELQVKRLQEQSSTQQEQKEQQEPSIATKGE